MSLGLFHSPIEIRLLIVLIECLQRAEQYALEAVEQRDEEARQFEWSESVIVALQQAMVTSAQELSAEFITEHTAKEEQWQRDTEAVEEKLSEL